MELSKIEDALQDLQRGRFLIVIDDEGRENEADLFIAAEKATPTKVNFMIKKAGGLICVPMPGEWLDRLNIPLMVAEEENCEVTKCKFTVSVDYKKGTTTGISAFDRSATIRALADENSKEEDFAKPGHIFPLRYEEGGVLSREGHTEAAVDLCKLAGLKPVGVICEIIKKNGETLKASDLEHEMKFDIKVISIKDLIEYMKAHQEGSSH